ncbi:actin-related protein 2 precursor [Magallana gigas]|uniref:Serine/threonine-protein kinase receptor n=1 Tax=Magallana gigas TaxID=29159 RepID=B6VP46_MAGGI|nr:actin-related protein 2 precursor [Crassostrea gigas]CAR92545.1 activin type II receptor precursor [Crassostrea gigas]|eukprot:NP_001292259.1 actin-related protein 2 precursor [Crassostrea gigas]
MFWINIFTSVFFILQHSTGSWSAEAKAAAQRRCVVLYPNCTENGGQSCQRYEYCEPGSHYCFTAWSQNNASANGIELKHQGCWTQNQGCENDSCIQSNLQTQSVSFCCCHLDKCNINISMVSIGFSQAVTEKGPTAKVQSDGKAKVMEILMYSLVPIIVLVILIVIVFVMWRCYYNRNMYTSHLQLPACDPEMGTQEFNQPHRPIQLLELRAHGRFGEVWKANMLDAVVAVKIMPFKEKASWLAEQEIYNLPHMKHDNILLFVGGEKHEENLWLITEFHEKGSLCEILKGNSVTWSQLCKIAESMVRGLAYLHDDVSLTRCQSKPAVAHRDFKSKNVLLKEDLTACIADFGLALKFEPGKSPGETHGLVGTRRYMAPEILEGAISFRKDAFLRIDMYACGLVLWELLSRNSCSDQPADEYQLPFEEEAGSHPTLEDMQELVVMKKLRPTIKNHWLQHPGLEQVAATIEGCWDQDAEARVSAICVQERLSQLSRTLNVSTSSHNLSISPNQNIYYHISSVSN